MPCLLYHGISKMRSYSTRFHRFLCPSGSANCSACVEPANKKVSRRLISSSISSATSFLTGVCTCSFGLIRSVNISRRTRITGFLISPEQTGSGSQRFSQRKSLIPCHLAKSILSHGIKECALIDTHELFKPPVHHHSLQLIYRHFFSLHHYLDLPYRLNSVRYIRMLCQKFFYHIHTKIDVKMSH